MRNHSCRFSTALVLMHQNPVFQVLPSNSTPIPTLPGYAHKDILQPAFLKPIYQLGQSTKRRRLAALLDFYQHVIHLRELFGLYSSYQCHTSRGHDAFACISYFTGTSTFDVSFFIFIADSAGLTTSISAGTTRDVWANDFILAYGMVVHTASDDIISTSSPTTSVPDSTQSSYSSATPTTTPTTMPTDPSQYQSPGLSHSAVAGIAAGSTLAGVILIGTVVALFLRRRRSPGEAQSLVNVSETGGAWIKSPRDNQFFLNNG
ncbi:hypothetical protein F4859DRAFT_302804 [Xylaria cf. heliscus]|nr:hypothetical protein F4859DRAFT_302804 [Xylaria cf. heliscus]